MLLKTILNRVAKFKSFVYGNPRFFEAAGGPIIEVPLEPRSNSKAICSGCGQISAGYDRLSEPRRFRFVPLWGIAVVFVYTMRRVQCRLCGIRIEQVPWSDGKSPLTSHYQWFLAKWAKRLSWQETADAFGTTWDSVARSVRMAVEWGLSHRTLEGIKAIGIDEIGWRAGHTYLTLVYQIDEGSKRLLWIGEHRTSKTLLRFFRMLGKEGSERIEFVCTDMWQPYLKVIAKKAKNALNILDRFHIVKKLLEAIDKVRAEEAKRLERDGYEPVLKNSRWCLLKHYWNLTTKQTVKLGELLRYNLKTVRAYLLKEDFHRFWEYTSPYWADRFLEEWCRRTMRSKIAPMKKVAKSLRAHRSLIMNWFHAQGKLSSGVVEGFNNKVKLTLRRSYGWKEYETAEMSLYHGLGNLPEPEFTHRFV